MAGPPPLVGRRDDLALLTSALTPGREPRTLVLVGEAGVGKTRLLTEGIREAASAGVRTLPGGCLPLAGSVPFLPIAEALRGLGLRPPPVLDRCAPHVRTELARLVPAWGPAPAPPGDGEGWQRGRLFAALRDLLAEAATDGPHALVVEDVHWADPSTQDFLSYHGAVDRNGVTPLVLTCREEALTGPWLAEFIRRPDVRQVRLGRLSHEEIAQHLAGMLGGTAAGWFVDEVFARAGGNAFFTEQLVAAATRDGTGPQPGAPLPADLVELMVGQVDAVARTPATR